jgi:hypothetical protein
MKRRSLETRFWKDNYIQSLTANGKLLFNYLLMNEYVNIIHIYELPETYISLETGITIKQIQDLKIKFQQDNKFLFKDSWIKIVNADKYEHYEGNLNDRAKENLLKIIPSHVLDYFNTPIDRDIDTQPKVSSNQYPITNNQQSITNKYNNIENLKEEDLETIAEKYQVPVSFVKSKLDDMTNWIGANGKKYKDYYLALCNWVKKDALKVKKGGTNGKFVIADITNG